MANLCIPLEPKLKCYTRNMKITSRRIRVLITVALLLLLPIAVASNKQTIIDWNRLRNYQPDSEIVRLSKATTMTRLGERLFYVNNPELNDKSTFSQHCKNNEQTIILGCYISNTKIYIFDVSDKRLSGVEEVTSAHEMLHAAYDRLNVSEKKRINFLINEAYKGVTNTRIFETIASYKRAGANINNELHSILGTEVAVLSDELEAYYGKYFSDRSVIVGFFDKYEQEFVARRAKVAADDAKLNELQEEIEAIKEKLKNEYIGINDERERMDRLIASKRIEEYNNLVVPFNSRVNSYNNTVTEVQRLIQEYNNLVIERNNIATEENELIKAIDSSPSSI